MKMMLVTGDNDGNGEDCDDDDDDDDYDGNNESSDYDVYDKSNDYDNNSDYYDYCHHRFFSLTINKAFKDTLVNKLAEVRWRFTGNVFKLNTSQVEFATGDFTKLIRC